MQMKDTFWKKNERALISAHFSLGSSGWLISLPSVTWIVLFFIVPSIFIAVFAFKPADLYGGVKEGWTLQTILQLASPVYIRLLFRTFWLSAVTTLICLTLAVPATYHLVSLPKKKQNLLLTLVIVPFWSSLLIRIFAWKTLLHPEGLFHKILSSLFLISPNSTLLYNTSAVLFVMVYSYLPFAILPIYAAATRFDMQLIDAAMDLGTTRKQAIWKVFLPGIETGIAAATLLVFIPAVGTYVIPDLVGGINSAMLGNRIAQKTLVERNIPQASALALMLAGVVLGMMLLMRTAPKRKVKIYDEVRNRE